MWIKIEPDDVLMFRGSRPFSAGQSFVARSSFPPNPQVMTGTIRSAVIRQSDVSFEDYSNRQIPADLAQKIGLAPERDKNAGTLGTLTITGPFVCKIDENGAVERLLPVPHDVLHDKSQKVYVTLQPSRQFAQKMLTNAPFDSWQPLVIPQQSSLPDGDDYSFKGASGWLTERAFQTYLSGQQIKPDDVIPHERVVVSESHIGIGLDYSRRAVDEDRRLLYRAEFDRPVASETENYHIGLMAQVNDGLLNERGYLTPGGERRFAAYSTIPYQDTLTPPSGKNRLKVVLLTPAYFDGGWQPSDGNWQQWIGETGKLISISASSPTIISGWDVANNRPKPLYRYMPAGSVYYFEDAVWQDNPFTQSPTSLDAGAMGFGSVAVGTWDYLD